jgi:hypothetical protein
LVLIGSFLVSFRARAFDIFWRVFSVLGSRGFVPDDIRDAIDLYLDGTLVVDHLVQAVRRSPRRTRLWRTSRPVGSSVPC